VKNICFFCSSSSAIPKDFFEKGGEIANIFAKNGFNLVFGAGNFGLMGEVAKIFYKNNCSIIGIVPEKIYKKMPIFEKIENLIITKNISERIDKMVEISDAFLILPGGFGTMQELINVITLKQLDYIDKPIAVYNYKDYYGNLLKQFDNMFKYNFCKGIYKDIYLFSDNINEIYDYITNYRKINISEEKWFC